MKYSNVYKVEKYIKTDNSAGKEFWMYKAVYIPIVIILSLLDGVTLFMVFHAITGENLALQLIMTSGIALALNFIPLIIGRLIHVARYAKATGKKRCGSILMIIILGLAFFLLFVLSLILRYKARDDLLGTQITLNSTSTTSIYSQSNGGHASNAGLDTYVSSNGKLKTYALLTGVVPFVTSVINLALGYLTSDPVRERLYKLRHLRVKLLKKLNIMYAASYELDQDWTAYFRKLEKERCAAACGEILGCSELIKATARTFLKEKLGDPKSITELSKKS